MLHDPQLLFTLTGALAAALVLGFVAHRLRLSPIVGYLLAGVVVGPFTPGFVARGDLAEQLAEIGVILLMFGVGLHFHLKDLLAVRKVAAPGALAQVAVATGLGVLLAVLSGWRSSEGLVFGLAISVASTVVLLRVLADHRALHTPAGHVAVGWLIIEDLFTVMVLVMLPVLAGSSKAASTPAVLLALAVALLKIGGLVAFVFIVGQRVLPLVLTYVARTHSRELFTLTVLVLALGIAVGSARLFGTSMALGAFLAGMVVGQSTFGSRAASEALPLRDAFAVLFFVSVGMLFDPRQLGAQAGLTAATLAVILVGKPLAAYVTVRLLRHPRETALRVAVALAQIGEFSFILGALGRQLGVLPAGAMQVLVAASLVSITVNPLLFRLVGPLERHLSAREARRGRGQPTAAPGPGPDEAGREPPPVAHSGRIRDRAVVVGHGPVGRTVMRLLLDSGIEPVVIDLDHEAVARLKRQGIEAVYGDASQPEILELAGVRDARSLIYTASGTPAHAVVEAATELNPELQILARSTYVREIAAARRAGAHVVISAEAEVALAMTEHLLAQLGATREQLDQARDRLHEELAEIAGR